MRFKQYIDDNISIDECKARLIIEGVEGGEYPLRREGEEYYFEPNLEIEGDKRIQFLLFPSVSDFKTLPANVNRLRHEPNYLPALGASAFHECVRVGGEEGLAKAFTIAQNSGKEDWLLYLFTHWSLEKILVGMRKGSPGSEDIPETDNITPSLKEKKRTDYTNKVLRKNVSDLLGLSNIRMNLKKFLDKFDELSGENIEKTIKYNKFCFPLFLEIAFKFYAILNRE